MTDKTGEIKALAERIRNCDECFDRSCKRCIVGSGKLNPKFMFVAQAPAVNMPKEHVGLPIGGNCESIYQKTLQILGETRETVWSTNVIKCVEAGVKEGLAKNCAVFIKEEVALVNPDKIVAMGAVAKLLLKTFVNREILYLPHPIVAVRNEVLAADYFDRVEKLKDCSTSKKTLMQYVK